MPVMLKNLLLAKRMFLEGTGYADRSDPISSGLAISLFQDSVEIFVWALIKEQGVQTKEGSGFVANVEALTKQGISLSHLAKLSELNKARIGFKHYGNLPDQNEAGKFQAYVEDFLRDSFQKHFDVAFDDISLSDLISDSEISAMARSKPKCNIPQKEWLHGKTLHTSELRGTSNDPGEAGVGIQAPGDSPGLESRGLDD